MKKIFIFISLILSSFQLFAHSGVMAGQKELKINKTKYFDVIYAEGSERSAKIIYDLADEVYEEVAEKLNLKHPFRLPVVVSPGADEFNAYFSSGPFNHIVVYDTVCTESIAVFTEELLNTFRHELIHAITYNLRNDAFYKIDKIFGDVYNPALLTITTAWAEGATVSMESDFGEGRLNDDYALFMIRQAKLDGSFPKYSAIQGAMDVYPATRASYLFGGAFNGWLQEKYGMEKYAEFWYRCVNFKSITYFTCFKKVYGIKIKDAWKEFYDSIEVPAAKPFPEEEKWCHSYKFTKKSLYNCFASAPSGFYYYDEYSAKVMSVQGEKSHCLFSMPGVLRLSASKNGKFLAVTYQNQNGPTPKNKIKIFDLEKKSFFEVKESSLRDGAVIFHNGDYFLCAVKTESAYCTLKVFQLCLKNGKIKDSKLVYEQKIGQEQQIFSPEGDDSGNFFYIQKNGLNYSVRKLNVESKQTTIYRLPEEKMVVQSLSWSKYNESPEISFSFTKKGSFPRLGFLKLSETPEWVLMDSDFSGGFFFPVQTGPEKISYAAHFLKYTKLLRAEISDLSFSNIAAENMTFESEVFARYDSEMDGLLEFLEGSKKFSSFTYTFTGPRGTIVPVALTETFSNASYNRLESIILPFGVTYISSTPWTNPLWYVSAGYNLLTNSEAARIYIKGNSMTDLFSYSAIAQVEFDVNGYKQTYENLSLNFNIPIRGTFVLNLSDSGTILEGRQSETTITKEEKDDIKSIFDYFHILESSEKQYFYANNAFSLGVSNIYKSGMGHYDYSGFKLYSVVDTSFYSLAEDFDRNIKYGNISFNLLFRNSTILPLIFEASLFPSDSYIAAGLAKIILFNHEFQNSTNILPLFYSNRITLSSYYVARFADDLESWAVKDACKYLGHLRDGKFDYSDELALTASYSFTPNIGGLARKDFQISVSGSAKYRFNPAENEKYFNFSAGLSTNFSY